MLAPQTDRLTIILAILCLATAVGAWYLEPPDLEAGRTGAKKHDISIGADDLSQRIDQQTASTETTIDQYAEILARPLFNPSRRPAAVIADQPADTPPSRSTKTTKAQFTLVGIMIIDDKRMAMVQESIGRVTRLVEVGDKIDGWRIKALTPDTVTLGRDSHSKTLELERKGNPILKGRAKAVANKRREQPRAPGIPRTKSKSPSSDKPSAPNNDSGKSQVSDDDDENE